MGYSPWGCKESATTERRGNTKQGSYERVLVLAPELASRRPWLSAVNVAPARRVSGLPGWLTVTPFPAQVLAAEENVDFRIHVENQSPVWCVPMHPTASLCFPVTLACTQAAS